MVNVLRPERAARDPSVQLSPTVVAALFMIVSITLWAGSFRATEVATEHASAVTVSALRAAPAAVILIVAVYLSAARLPQTRSLWFWAGVSGLLMVTFNLIVLAEAIDRAGGGNAAVLINTSPFWIALMSWVFLGERIPVLGIAGLLLGFTGVVVMVSSQLGGDAGTADLALGMALALLGAVAWAIGTFIVKRLVVRQPSLDLTSLTAGQYLVGGAVLLILAFALEDTGQTDWASGELWISILFLALGASVIATLGYFGALRRTGATATAAWLFLIPVIAVVIEVALGDAPEGIVLVGMALAIGGVALVNLSPLLVGEPLRPSGRSGA